jgi:AraC-like DNA-binding protein
MPGSSFENPEKWGTSSAFAGPDERLNHQWRNGLLPARGEWRAAIERVAVKLSLLKTQPVRRSSDPGAQVRSSKTETNAFKQVSELLEKELHATLTVLITTMPRGALQIAQPAKLPDELVRSYGHGFHLDDRLSWQVILQNKPLRIRDVSESDNRFLTEFLTPSGVSFAAAAPLAGPILEGFPGALHLYRAAGQGGLTDSELARLGRIASEFDQTVARARSLRASPARSVLLTPRPHSRLFVFNPAGKQILPRTDFEAFDPSLRTQMSDYARNSLARLKTDTITAHRVQLPDSYSDLWTFRAVVYPKYPALDGSPLVVFTLQPTCAEWAELRASDFPADPELARLIPAMKFMQNEYHRGPTLHEIAAQVHLSPFHFHRRFAELLGLTPKHFMLSCQITQAKQELLARRKDLAKIATDCGFAHQSHFTSRFKQATGLTPTRWRRAAMNAIPA